MQGVLDGVPRGATGILWDPPAGTPRVSSPVPDAVAVQREQVAHAVGAAGVSHADAHGVAVGDEVFADMRPDEATRAGPDRRWQIEQLVR